MKKVCKRCRSENIKINAWVIWDPDKEDYVLVDVFKDEVWCDACEESTDMIEIGEKDVGNVIPIGPRLTPKGW